MLSLILSINSCSQKTITWAFAHNPVNSISSVTTLSGPLPVACYITVYPGTLAFSNVLMIASSSLSLNIKSNLFIFLQRGKGDNGIY